jgi:polyisoprenoid-binding protein YceI
MATFDASSADCRVFTFKDGALSALAHDLELRVTRFAIEVQQSGRDHTVTATFEAASLVVVHALKNGQPTDQLSESDRRKIEKTIGDVLDVRKHPQIRFEATVVAQSSPGGDGFVLTGQLALQGRRRTMGLQARPRNGRMTVEATVHQPDFGIRPYTALLGALKVRPDVQVRISLPWPG